MSCMYTRGKMLWLAYNDVQGERVCKSSGYRVGQEAQALALLAELEAHAKAVSEDVPGQSKVLHGDFGRRRTGDADDTDDTDDTDDAGDAAPAVIPIASRISAPARAAVVVAVESPGNGITVEGYGEQWLASREDIATIRDERGRLRNHVFPLIGNMRMVDVRPRHIRDFVKALRKSRVHLRGTGKGRGTELLAPRTVRHVFALLRQMFESAIIDEVVTMNPVRVKKGVLPKNVDKDPAWRKGAIFERAELLRLASEPAIPRERRILYALKGMAGVRHGEAAGLRWRLYNPNQRPLAEFVLARSYEKDGTKTMVTRSVPAHPVLAALIDEWYREGWEAVYGRRPTPDDFIVPRSLGQRIGEVEEEVDEAWDEDDWEGADDEAAQVSDADHAQKLFLRDLAALGMRRRRGHDLRRTFITLAQMDGAKREALQVITHAPDAEDVMSLYTSFPFEALCEEVAKFKIALPPPGEGMAPNEPPGRAGGGSVLSSPAADGSAPVARLSAPPHLALGPSVPEPQPIPRGISSPDMPEKSGASPRSGCSATCSATCSCRKPNNFEPLPGYDPGTYGLRNRCSTTELQRRGEG